LRTAFEDLKFAPIVVGLIEGFKGVGVVWVGTVGIEGDDFRDVLKHWIGFEGRSHHLSEFHRIRLENFQAPSHLRGEGLLLGQRLMEGCVCHNIAEFVANVIPSEKKATLKAKNVPI